MYFTLSICRKKSACVNVETRAQGDVKEESMREYQKKSAGRSIERDVQVEVPMEEYRQ